MEPQGQHVQRPQPMQEEDLSSIAFLSYWTVLGKIVTLFSLPLIVFTVIFGLRVNNSISWSYWYIFLPIFFLLLLSLLVSTSERLSQPAPIQVRMAWLLAIISTGTFVMFLILKLEGHTDAPWKFFCILKDSITFVLFIKLNKEMQITDL
jgi:hypothetical protein